MILFLLYNEERVSEKLNNIPKNINLMILVDSGLIHGVANFKIHVTNHDAIMSRMVNVILF